MTDLREERIHNLVSLSHKLSFENDDFERAVNRAQAENAWFTEESIRTAVSGIRTNYLQDESLRKWLEPYDLIRKSRKIGIIAAGNIPLVGFHDMICSYLSGHLTLIKTSDKDDALMRFAVEELVSMHERQPPIEIVNQLKGHEAVIATGSNQSKIYFKNYFNTIPHVLRGHRNGVAVLSGDESAEDLTNLGLDVFTYYGLGCRNVSKLYLPRGYDVFRIMEAFEGFAHVADHHKYKNNLDYNVALFLLSKFKYLDNGVILLLENEAIPSRIASLHYSFYDDVSDVEKEISDKAEQIQCVVSNLSSLKNAVPLGKAQNPALSDYADDVDTMRFLSQLDQNGG